MIGIILLGLLLLGVVASAAYSMLLMTDNTQSMIRAQTEKQLLEQAHTVIINSLRPLGENQKLIAPVGSYDGTDISPIDGIPDVDYQQLPKLYGIKTKNAWGIEIVYCPISDPIGINSLPTQNIALTDTLEYSAKYVSDHDSVRYAYQTDFVQNSSYSNRDVLAFLISRKPGSTATCSDVTFDAGKYRASSALVKAITRDSILTYQANQPIMIDASNYADGDSINQLSSSWDSTQPLRFIINLTDGNDRDLTENLSFINQFPGNNKEIYIKGSGSAVTDILNSSGKTIHFENMSVTIEGVSFGANISLSAKSSNLVTNDVVINGDVKLNDSMWSLAGSTSLSSKNGSNLADLKNSVLVQNGESLTLSMRKSGSNEGAIKLTNSSWSIDGAVASISTTFNNSAEAIIAEMGSEIIISDGATLNLSSDRWESDVVAYIDHSSVLVVDNGIINNNDKNKALLKISGKAIFTDSTINSFNSLSKAILIDGGDVRLINSDISFNGPPITIAVELDNGGVVRLQESNIGTSSNPTIFGVLDNGGRHVSGKSSKINSVNCWVGLIFNSVPSTNSGFSIPIDHNYKIFNQSNWSCN